MTTTAETTVTKLDYADLSDQLETLQMGVQAIFDQIQNEYENWSDDECSSEKGERNIKIQHALEGTMEMIDEAVLYFRDGEPEDTE